MHQIAVFKSWDDRPSKGNFHWRNISYGSFPCDSSRLFLATTQLQSPGRLKSNHALGWSATNWQPKSKYTLHTDIQNVMYIYSYNIESENVCTDKVR